MALVSDTPGTLSVIAKDNVPDAIVSMIPSDRKSGLLSPTMCITGLDAELFSVDFSPDGRYIAVSGMDRSIQIYNVYGECEGVCALFGHTTAVLQIKWNPDGNRIYSASADHSVAVWDIETATRVKKLRGHSAVVNTLHRNVRNIPYIVSGSDDGTTKVWDCRTRRCVKTFPHTYQILAVSFDDTAERVFAGSLDGSIRVFDMRNDGESDVFWGCGDSITGMDINGTGTRLATNSMDQFIRLWDLQPFCKGNRRVGAMTGATHNFEKNLLKVRFNEDGTLLAAGSADRYACVWDIQSGKLLYRLPGHQGSVNEVCFHPKEPIIASCSSDKRVYLGELSD